VFRGGSWNYGTDFLRASDRFSFAPDHFNNSIGCRAARSP
jgi:formylglycine-generating enzyme required for sulfatase activity